MKSQLRIVVAVLALALLAPALLTTVSAGTGEAGAKGRIFILVVWDGLRPDFVTQHDTPNLFAMAHEGVRFDHHHSLYPTLTMVNAAALATGTTPAVSGVMGNTMYFEPLLGSKLPTGSALRELIARPESMENPSLLSELSGPNGFNGHLLGLDTIAQEAARENGYIAAVGKEAPSFLFDNRVRSVSNGLDVLHEPHNDYLFVTDSLVEPVQQAKEIGEVPRPAADDWPSWLRRDEFFTRIVTDKAIPAAKAASEKGRPALIVLWLHEPDWAQHRAGLGTLQSLQALSACDADLGRVRNAIERNGMAARTDLMAVSDHGFATMRMKISLKGLLVAAGLKKSLDSTDIVVAPNSGSDFIYVSPTDFPTVGARRAILQKIVDFAEAQEWCGPVFSRDPAQSGDSRRRRANEYLGWIDGTFSQAAVGIYNQARSPDLVISFREYPDLDNSALTGPSRPAFELDAKGQHAVVNQSKELVHPVTGVTYADAGGKLEWTTGMGTHGAVGARELHNFCAASGPDFREHFVDRNPTGNADVALTITKILGLEPNVGPGGAYATGRPMEEALSDGSGAPGAARAVRMTANLDLQGVRIITTLSGTQLKGWLYLDGSNVEHVPLGRSP